MCNRYNKCIWAFNCTLVHCMSFKVSQSYNADANHNERYYALAQQQACDTLKTTPSQNDGWVIANSVLTNCNGNKKFSALVLWLCG